MKSWEQIPLIDLEPPVEDRPELYSDPTLFDLNEAECRHGVADAEALAEPPHSHMNAMGTTFWVTYLTYADLRGTHLGRG